MSRIPIRWRVTLAFTGSVALVLLGVGLFVHLRLEARIDESIDSGLRTRADEVAALTAGVGEAFESARGPRLTEADENFTQAIGADGRVVGATLGSPRRPLLRGDQLAGARTGPISVERDEVSGIDERVRLLAVPARTGGETIVVVGTALGDRDEALAELTRLLTVGGAVALLLASLAGYWAAGRALRPVDAMRRRAEEVSARSPGERLPVPRARDELRRLGLTLNEMLDRIEATLARERRFVDDASHELRTPLAVHRTRLELASRHGATATELRDEIRAGLDEVERLSGLADDLLLIARADQAGLTVSPQAIEAGELLETVRDRFAGRAAEARRQLTIEQLGELTLTADRRLLERALDNLLDNALRHGDGEIRVQVVPGADTIRFAVADRGPGFSEEFLPRAFERFSRADPARGAGGSGLGLAIVQSIAVAHGGVAGAENDVRGGALAWIDLPR